MKKSSTMGVLMLMGIIFFLLGTSFFVIGLITKLNLESISFQEGDGNVFCAVFMGIGGFFAVLGGIFLAATISGAIKNKKLKTNGYRLEGIVTNITLNTAIRINGYNPSKVECTVFNPYDGNTYLYNSGNTTAEVGHLMGQRVTVYVDKQNPKKYYVDLDSNTGGSLPHGVIDYRK